MSAVLGVVLAAFGAQVAWSADRPSDALDRARAAQTGVPMDAFERAVRTASVTSSPPVGHVDRYELDFESGPVARETEGGADSSWGHLALGAAFGAAFVLAILLMTIAIRRRPPRGIPPLAHR